MARKKQLDKLSRDMIQCEKDGFGVHYGHWMARQEEKRGKGISVIPQKNKDTQKAHLQCENKNDGTASEK